MKDYHPHVHFVVPGGGVSDDGSRWIGVKTDKLFHPLPAKQLYKSLFVEEIRKAGLYACLPYGVLKFDWVVNVKPVGNGQAVLKYLAPYVYRIAICDNRIESLDDSGVRYKVKPSGQTRFQTRRLGGESFVRSFAQHILPPGFTKVRYYGFMSPNCKLALADAAMAGVAVAGLDVLSGQRAEAEAIPKHAPPKCDGCGGDLRLIGITDSSGHWLWRQSDLTRRPTGETIDDRSSMTGIVNSTWLTQNDVAYASRRGASPCANWKKPTETERSGGRSPTPSSGIRSRAGQQVLLAGGPAMVEEREAEKQNPIVLLATTGFLNKKFEHRLAANH